MRKIVLTGASGGIGQAILEQLVQAGDRVVACCSGHPERIPVSTQITLFAGDLSRPEEVNRLFELVKKEFGAPDALINCAGIADIRLMQDSDDDNLLKLMNTNLLSCIRCTKEAVKLMLPKQAGRIINISSVWGLVGASCEAEYSATKGGIDAYTKAVAKELAPSGIPVNALSLGAFDTEMNALLSPEDREALKEEIPAGRLGKPEEAAQMVMLLLDAPVYLTGAVIKLDGGWI